MAQYQLIREHLRRVHGEIVEGIQLWKESRPKIAARFISEDSQQIWPSKLGSSNPPGGCRSEIVNILPRPQTRRTINFDHMIDTPYPKAPNCQMVWRHPLRTSYFVENTRTSCPIIKNAMVPTGPIPLSGSCDSTDSQRCVVVEIVTWWPPWSHPKVQEDLRNVISVAGSHTWRSTMRITAGMVIVPFLVMCNGEKSPYCIHQARKFVPYHSSTVP